MANGISTRGLLPFFRFWSGAFECNAAIGLDLPVRGHGELASKLGSFCIFEPAWLIALGTMDVSLVAAVLPMPITCGLRSHQHLAARSATSLLSRFVADTTAKYIDAAMKQVGG